MGSSDEIPLTVWASAKTMVEKVNWVYTLWLTIVQNVPFLEDSYMEPVYTPATETAPANLEVDRIRQAINKKKENLSDIDRRIIDENMKIVHVISKLFDSDEKADLAIADARNAHIGKFSDMTCLEIVYALRAEVLQSKYVTAILIPKMSKESGEKYSKHYKRVWSILAFYQWDNPASQRQLMAMMIENALSEGGESLPRSTAKLLLKFQLETEKNGDQFLDKLQRNDILDELDDIVGEKPTSANYVGKEKRQEKGEEKDYVCRLPGCKGKEIHDYRYCENAFCYRCRQKGHVATNCPTSKYLFVSVNSTTLLTHTTQRKDNWIVDSGASCHFTNNLDFLTECSHNNNIRIKFPDGKSTMTKLSGTVTFQIAKGQYMKIKPVYYVPEFQLNLMATSPFFKEYSVTLDESKIVLRPKSSGSNTITMDAETRDGLSYIKLQPELGKFVAANNVTDPTLWHDRLAHRSFELIKETLKTEGVKIAKDSEVEDCETCLLGKSKAVSCPKHAINKALKILDRVHMDLATGITPVAHDGSKHFLIIMDEFSRMSFTKAFVNKSDVPGFIINWVKRVENQTGRRIKEVRSDNGGEFVNERLEKFYAERGVEHQKIIPGSSHQNGFSENKVKNLKQMITCVLTHCKLPHILWVEALDYITYILNAVVTTKNKISPYTTFTGKQFDLTRFKVFGCVAYIHKNKEILPKFGTFDHKSVKGIFLGFPENKKGWIVYVPHLSRWLEVSHVHFSEKEFMALPPGFEFGKRTNRSPILSYRPFFLPTWHRAGSKGLEYAAQFSSLFDTDSGTDQKHGANESTIQLDDPMEDVRMTNETPSTPKPASESSSPRIEDMSLDEIIIEPASNAGSSPPPPPTPPQVSDQNMDQAVEPQPSEGGDIGEKPRDEDELMHDNAEKILVEYELMSEEAPPAADEDEPMNNEDNAITRDEDELMNDKSCPQEEDTLMNDNILRENQRDATPIQQVLPNLEQNNMDAPNASTPTAVSPKRIYEPLPEIGVKRPANGSPIRSPTLLRRSERLKKRRLEPLSKKEFLKQIKTLNVNNLTLQVDNKVTLPQTYGQAMQGKLAEYWKRAMEDEVLQFSTMGAFDTVLLPDDKKMVQGRWVYDIKYHENGSILKFKARYVAKGYSQTYGRDFTKTFAPTLRADTLRMLLAKAAKLDLEIIQLDISSAFLHADIDAEIYLQPPPGFETYDSMGNPLTWKLNKAVYGLRQSPHLWGNKVVSVLQEEGFKAIQSEPCLFVIEKNGERIELIYHVDDFLLIGNHGPFMEQVRNAFQKHFKTKDLGEVRTFLGINMTRNREKRSITLSQAHYAREVLERTQMASAHPVSTPLPCLEMPEYDPDENFHTPKFLEIVGMLNYMCTWTRPDLAYAVSTMSGFLSNHNKCHYESLKHILRYLVGTQDFKMTYEFDKDSDMQESPFVAYTDSDWAGNEENRRSRTGYCINWHGACIAWCSKLQSTVAQSAMEAEFLALSKVVTHVQGLQNAYSSLVGLPSSPATIFEDNQACLKVANGEADLRRVRHVQIKQHFVRDRVAVGAVELHYVPSADNVADIFTKPSKSSVLLNHIPKINLLPKHVLVNCSMGTAGSVADWSPIGCLYSIWVTLCNNEKLSEEYSA